MTNCVKNEDNTVTLSVTVEGDDWKKAQKKIVSDARAKMNIKGFRKGQAPEGVIRRTLGHDYILYQAADQIARKELNDLLDEYNIDPIDTPSLDIPEITEEKVDLVFTCPVAPKASLGQWKNLGIEKRPVVVGENEVEDVINSLAKQQAANILVEDENGAQLEDDLTFDDSVLIDGEPVGIFTRNNYTDRLTSDFVFPGVGDAIVGLKSEESRDIPVTIPEDFPEDIKGKEAVYHIDLHEIYRESLPELNDEFAANAGLGEEVKTMDDLRSTIRKSLEERAQDKADDEYFTAVLKTAVDNASVEIPEAMIETEIDALLRSQKAQYQRYGIDFDSYIKNAGLSEQQVRDDLRQEAASRVKNTLVLEAIADELALAVTEEEIEKEYQTFADSYRMELDQVKKAIPVHNMEKDLVLQKASDALIEAQNEGE